MITQHSLDALKASVNILDVIAPFVELRKSGANYVACCPFHDEKTPSFVVSPQKGFYHCYGCGVGGDSIKFLMEYEKLSFVESAEKVAALSNFTLEYEKGATKKPDSTLLSDITRFYQKNLLAHKPSLDYLISRGVAESSIEQFCLGYCGASFETLKFINAKGLNKQEALELGVIGKDGEREYARFSNRIMFPIHASNGKIVGFGGRTLNSDNTAKYINSPQSKIFNKSRLLYGYYIAKDKIFKQKKIIVCEGYLDVIMLHQAGFDYAVATLGTALTKEHLPLLNKGEPKIILSYDGDKAGINAAFKAAKMLAAYGSEGGVVIFENGADPADMVANKLVDKLSDIFANPTPFVPFVLRHIAKDYDLSNPLQKQKALAESSAFLHTLSPLLQEEYKPTLARLLSLPLSLIHTKRPNIAPHPMTNTQDLAESILIKSFLQSPQMLDFAIEYIDSSLFFSKREAFNLLMQKQFDAPPLLAINLDENIKALSDIAALKEHLRLFISQAYSHALSQIPHIDNLDLQTKGKLIKDIKHKILSLKEGALLPYVSTSTF